MWSHPAWRFTAQCANLDGSVPGGGTGCPKTSDSLPPSFHEVQHVQAIPTRCNMFRQYRLRSCAMPHAGQASSLMIPHPVVVSSYVIRNPNRRTSPERCGQRAWCSGALANWRKWPTAQRGAARPLPVVETPEVAAREVAQRAAKGKTFSARRSGGCGPLPKVKCYAQKQVLRAMSSDNTAAPTEERRRRRATRPSEVASERCMAAGSGLARDEGAGRARAEGAGRARDGGWSCALGPKWLRGQ